MEYEHNFLENFIRFYCTTLYFYYCTNSLFITCNLFFAIFFKKVLTKTSCYSAVDIVGSVMVYYVETVLVDVLEQDRQACYDAVRIAGSVLNTKS